MQALKSLVIGLALLIVVAMTVIAYGLYRKSDDPDFKFFSLGGEQPAQPTILPQPEAMPTAPVRAFGDVMLSLPEGCVISSVSGDGQRIFLKIGPATPSCERVLVVNATDGSLLGTLKVSP